ncbi:MAG: TolC family protein [Pirellulales bacterium]|nr:TolC family protein [Pirellulales bacterium]
MRTTWPCFLIVAACCLWRADIAGAQPAKQPAAPPPSPPAVAQFGLHAPPSGAARVTPLPPAAPETVRGRKVPGTTLDEVVGMALANSPNLREAADAATAARGEALQAGLYPNPTINVQSPQMSGAESQYNGFATQEFITAGKLRLSRGAAMQGWRQAQLNFVRTRFELLTAVRTTFYSTLVAQERVEVLRNLVGVATRSREAAEKLYEGGEGAKTDALLLRIEQDRAEMELENALALLAATRRELTAAIGLPQITIMRVRGDLSAALPDLQYEAVRQGVLSRNAAAEIARVEIRRNRLLLERAIVEPIPNLTAMAGYQRQIFPEMHQAIWQFTMTVPLWNRNQGNIRAAQANVGVASQQLARVQNELSAQVAEALGNFIQAQERVNYFQREILPRAREIQHINAEAFAQGEVDFLRLLASQRTLLESNLANVASQEQRWLAGARLAGLLQIERFP